MDVRLALALLFCALASLGNPRGTTASPEAAEFLRSAMFHFAHDPHASSKADFTSPEDNIEAGVVREGPEPSQFGASGPTASALERIRIEIDHGKHAQMIQSQHKTPVYAQQQQQPQPQPVYGGQSPVYPHADAGIYGQTSSNTHSHTEVIYKQNSAQNTDQQQQQPPPSYQDVPAPPPISKEELKALYQSALQKGTDLDLSQFPANADGLGEPNVGSMPGYYYYYYPIKQFPKGGGDDGNKGQNGGGNGDGNGSTGVNTKVEPLFVAMTAFIGMSMAFMFSMLFLPKIGFLRSSGIGLLSRLAPDDLTSLTRVVMESIDGKDCDLRIACELGRVLRKFQLHDKPIRFLESFVSKEAKLQLQNVRRAGIYRPKCAPIRCKRRQGKP